MACDPPVGRMDVAGLGPPPQPGRRDDAWLAGVGPNLWPDAVLPLDEGGQTWSHRQTDVPVQPYPDDD